MLGHRCYKQVNVVFKPFPARPQLERGPQAKQVNKSYMPRLREVHQAHSVQYISNASCIDNLYSRSDLATRRVSEIITTVMGNTEKAQQAAAVFRICRVRETPEEVSRRTVAHTGPIQVCKEDPDVHKGLPTFVWKTPELDRASYNLSAKLCSDWKPAQYEHLLMLEHIAMFRAAMAQQQHIIRCLVNALSEQTILTQLHKILRNNRVPKKTITRICAKVVGLQCHWTTEVPAHWLSEPIKARSSGQHPSCVVEEVICSNSSKGWRLFSVQMTKAVAAAGVAVASMLANRRGA